MLHDCIKGFWKEYYEGLTAAMEKCGTVFTTFEEFMSEEGDSAPWETYDYTPEEHYFNVVHEDELFDAFQENDESFYAAVCYAVDYVFAGSIYSIERDDAECKITVLENGKAVVSLNVECMECIDIIMSEYIYNAVKVYPEVLENSASIRDNTATIEREVLDNTVQILMIIAGRTAELLDSCDR